MSQFTYSVIKEAKRIFETAMTDEKYKNYFIYSKNRIYFDKKVQDLFDFDDIEFFECKLYVIIDYTYSNIFNLYKFKLVSNSFLTCDYIPCSREFATVELIKKHLDEFIDFLPELIEAYKNFKKKELIVKQLEEI